MPLGPVSGSPLWGLSVVSPPDAGSTWRSRLSRSELPLKASSLNRWPRPLVTSVPRHSGVALSGPSGSDVHPTSGAH